MTDTKLTRAQELELAGYIAPVLRGARPEAKARRVVVYNQQTGEIVRYARHEEALKALAAVHGLEHAAADGVRPCEIPCERCGRPMPTKKCGPPQKYCRRCVTGICMDCGVVCPASGKKKTPPKRCRDCHFKALRRPPQQIVCAGEACDKPVPRGALDQDKVSRRNGEPWRCLAHRRLAKTGLLNEGLVKQSVCAGAGCTKRVPTSALCASQIKRRKGAPWRCVDCAAIDHPSTIERSRPEDAVEMLRMYEAGATLRRLSVLFQTDRKTLRRKLERMRKKAPSAS